MSSDNDSTTRINIVIDSEQNTLLNKMLPWGAKSDIIRNIVEILIKDLEQDSSGDFYSALVKHNVKLVKIEE
ncbi:MAG: hypothetical protein COA94_04865 [Rickettsiales bacterium]|nr:MAG: hypothetical protein COA94_04865 [Rickettsiales bacterium]